MAGLLSKQSDYPRIQAGAAMPEPGWQQRFAVTMMEAANANRCAEHIREVRVGRNRKVLWQVDLLRIGVIAIVVCIRLQSGYSAIATPIFSLPEAAALASCGALIILLEQFRRLRYNRATAALFDDNHKQNLPVLIELVPHIRGKQVAAAKARLTRLLLNLESTDRILNRLYQRFWKTSLE